MVSCCIATTCREARTLEDLPAQLENCQLSLARQCGLDCRVLGSGAGPVLRFYVRENRIADFNRLQLLDLLRRDLVRGFKAPPCIQQRSELLQVSVEALLRVVAG